MSTPPIGAGLTAESAKLLEPGDVLRANIDWITEGAGRRLTRGNTYIQAAGADPDGPWSVLIEECDAGHQSYWDPEDFTFVARPSQAQEPSVPSGELRSVEPGWLAQSLRRAEIEMAARRLMPDLMAALRNGATEDGLRTLLASSLPAPEASGAGGWLSPDTAPTDGPSFLVCTERRNVYVVFRRSDEGARYLHFGGGLAREVHEEIWGWQPNPHTLLAPLPAAPVQADSTEGVGA